MYVYAFSFIVCFLQISLCAAEIQYAAKVVRFSDQYSDTRFHALYYINAGILSIVNFYRGSAQKVLGEPDAYPSLGNLDTCWGQSRLQSPQTITVCAHAVIVPIFYKHIPLTD